MMLGFVIDLPFVPLGVGLIGLFPLPPLPAFPIVWP